MPNSIGRSSNCVEGQGVCSPHINRSLHPTTSSPQNASLPASSSQREFNQDMANFPVDPLPFIPLGIEIEDGGMHKVPRVVGHRSGNAVHAHEEYVLAVDTQQMLEADDIHPFMH
jgi:hypothetical protein